MHQRFIARKLLEFFVYSDPEPELIEALAQHVRAVRVRHRARPSARSCARTSSTRTRAIARCRRSPIEFAIGTLRYIGATAGAGQPVYQLARMGQEPLNPPSVKGWDGGPAWINTSTLLARFNFVNGLIAQTAPGKDGRCRGRPHPTSRPTTLVRRYGHERGAHRRRRSSAASCRTTSRRDVRATLIDYLNSQTPRGIGAEPAPVRARKLSRQDPRRARAHAQSPRQPARRSRHRRQDCSRMKRTTFVQSASRVAFLGGTQARRARAGRGRRAAAAGASRAASIRATCSSSCRWRAATTASTPSCRGATTRITGAADDPTSPRAKCSSSTIASGSTPRSRGSTSSTSKAASRCVQGVGYPNPNRSHFEATQIWETASPERPQQYGWLGRYLDRRYHRRRAIRRRVRSRLAGRHAAGGARRLARRGPGDRRAQRVRVQHRAATSRPSRARACCTTARRPGNRRILAMIAQTARDAYHGGDVLRATDRRVHQQGDVRDERISRNSSRSPRS